MSRSAGRPWPVLLLLWTLAITATPPVAAATTAQPVVSIIIDDLGKRESSGRRAVDLPGPVACAFLPHARHSVSLATAAHGARKEVLLHLPMQSMDGRPLDPGALRLDMTEQEFGQMLAEDLAAIPYVSGINNHMGSLLTRHPGHMLWLMRALRRHGDLYFVDSRTTDATVARRLARETGVPSTERRVFLDNEAQPRAIAAQFERLIGLARREGAALAIGHPYPQTLAFLEQELPKLARRGVRLVPVAELIRLQQQEEQTWQASLSHSPRAARNSKP